MMIKMAQYGRQKKLIITAIRHCSKDIAEVSRCQTVFENDTGGMTGTGGAATIDGGQVQLAAARYGGSWGTDGSMVTVGIR